MLTANFQLVEAAAIGKIGITYLKRFWSYIILKKSNQLEVDIMLTESNYINPMLNCLGIGLEPTIQFLYLESPTFEAFEDWIINNGIISKKLINLFNNAILQQGNSKTYKFPKNPVLNEKDLAHWDKEGYVIIRNAISQNDCQATVQTIYDFINANPSDSSTWYKPHPSKQGIMVQLFRHPTLDKNRLSSRIRTAYQQLWKRNDLMVSLDRVSFNPPETADYHFPGPNLHWDVSIKTPIPFGLQGLLYLSNTLANQGAFTLVPGFQNKIANWLSNLPKGVNPRKEDLIALGAKPIAANAGDFIIWHQALPHGSSPNTSKLPRIVQYINYQPINQEIQNEWI